MAERLTVSARRLHPSGAWEVSAIVCGCLTYRVYFGFTKREAVRLFRTELA